ncbi:MAG: hypothetical protein LUD81_04755 [Clostridiales bacterium]|nr:hypothetical protein [Clostridiales bacterium]
MNIKDYCKTIGRGPDCLEYALKLKINFPLGDILCLKSADGSGIFVENFDKTDSGEDYSCHCIFVYEGRVYDILHNNIDIDFDEYMEILKGMNKGGLAADRALSTSLFGLPAYKGV